MGCKLSLWRRKIFQTTQAMGKIGSDSCNQTGRVQKWPGTTGAIKEALERVTRQDAFGMSEKKFASLFGRLTNTKKGA